MDLLPSPTSTGRRVPRRGLRSSREGSRSKLAPRARRGGRSVASEVGLVFVFLCDALYDGGEVEWRESMWEGGGAALQTRTRRAAEERGFDAGAMLRPLKL